MSSLEMASTVLLWLGVAITVVSCIGVATVRRFNDRLHYVAGATSLGAPLVVISLALLAGSGRSALKLVVIAGLLAATGPATAAVTARARERGPDHGAEA